MPALVAQLRRHAQNAFFAEHGGDALTVGRPAAPRGPAHVARLAAGKGGGNGDSLAFFWFPDAPTHAPGIAAAGGLPGVGDIVSAHGSMNHVAFDVPVDKFDEYVEKLQAKGVEVSPVLNHDNSRSTVATEMNDEVFVRSVYFRDPDGILLEFACWTSPFGPDDVAHAPANAEGMRVEPAGA